MNSWWLGIELRTASWSSIWLILVKVKLVSYTRLLFPNGTLSSCFCVCCVAHVFYYRSLGKLMLLVKKGSDSVFRSFWYILCCSDCFSLFCPSLALESPTCMFQICCAMFSLFVLAKLCGMHKLWYLRMTVSTPVVNRNVSHSTIGDAQTTILTHIRNGLLATWRLDSTYNHI